MIFIGEKHMMFKLSKLAEWRRKQRETTILPLGKIRHWCCCDVVVVAMKAMDLINLIWL